MLLVEKDFPKVNDIVARAIMPLVNIEIANHILNNKELLKHEVRESIEESLEVYINWDSSILSKINLINSYEFSNLYENSDKIKQKEIEDNLNLVYQTLLKMKPILDGNKTEEEFEELYHQMVIHGLDTKYLLANKSFILPEFTNYRSKNAILKSKMKLIFGLYEGLRSKREC